MIKELLKQNIIDGDELARLLLADIWEEEGFMEEANNLRENRIKYVEKRPDHYKELIGKKINKGNGFENICYNCGCYVEIDRQSLTAMYYICYLHYKPYLHD